MDEQTLLTRYAAGDRRFYLIRLPNRKLPGAILAGVDFTEAIMSGINLRGAGLTGAKIDDNKLTSVRTLAGAVMPDGTTHKRLA